MEIRHTILPSMKSNKPKAITSSFIKLNNYLFNPLSPKNLKKSLSGDKIKEVSPPIKAVS